MAPNPTGARRRLIDAAVACAVLVVAEIAIITAHESGAIPRTWPAYALGVAMAAPILLRRWRPLLVVYAVGVALVVFYSIGYPGFPPAVVLAIPLYDAAHAGRAWPAVPVPVLLIGAGMVVAAGNGLTPLEVVDQFLPQLGLVAVALLLGALVRSRQAYATQTRQRLRELEAARERDTERRLAEERLRIAREMHDTLAHAMSTITVQSGTALYRLDDRPEQAREALTAIRRTSKEVLAEMRVALGALRDPDADGAGDERGLGDLPELLSAVRAAGLQVSVSGAYSGDGGGPAAPLPGRVDHAAYRIVQESLTNVLRHAGADATAEIRLGRDPDQLVVEVVDDGVGRAVIAGSGHGLSGMAERAEALGGRFEAGPRSSGGFRVAARLPLPGQEAS
ncbi:MAG: hypothetical protein J2P23_12420 [Microlunatus sp.]|nr:hypothetical protein [Microlunatus sp.]